MVLPVLFGLATAAAGAMSAIGNYQQGRAQTDATNLSRRNQYRDQLTLKQFREQREAALYRQEIADYEGNLFETERELNKSFTRLDKRAFERYGQAAFADVDRERKLTQSLGQIQTQMGAGGSRSRALALARGAAGMDEALMMDNLLRARMADMDQARDFTDQANNYRRRLFTGLSPVPMAGPTPTAPMMQQGPSMLSLIGGLGSAAIGGLSAGMSAQADMTKINTGGQSGVNAFKSVTGSGSPLSNAYRNFLRAK